jgi:AhpC/TSA family
MLVAVQRSWVRRILAGLGVLALLWVFACGGLYAIMRQSPETFARLMARVPGPVAFLVLPFETLWMRARAGTLHVGDPAPDFTLTKLDKSTQIRLSALTSQGQPVVLIFGSYT